MASNFPGGDDKKETLPAEGHEPEKKDTPATEEDTVDVDDDGGGRDVVSVPDPKKQA